MTAQGKGETGNTDYDEESLQLQSLVLVLVGHVTIRPQEKPVDLQNKYQDMK